MLWYVALLHYKIEEECKGTPSTRSNASLFFGFRKCLKNNHKWGFDIFGSETCFAPSALGAWSQNTS